jgi:hypothetical protein
LLITVAGRVAEQRLLDGVTHDAGRCTQGLGAAQIVGVDDCDMQSELGCEFRAHAVRLRGPEHDGALVGRQGAGVAVDGGDRFTEQFVEHAAASDCPARNLQHRGAEDAPRADLVDHELQRLGLVDRRQRSGAAGKHARKPRRPDRFRADETALRDRDRRFRDRDDIARLCQARERLA